MRKRVVAMTLAAALGLSALGVAVADTGSASTECNEHGTVSWSPTTLWPPNHKMKTVTIAFDEAQDDGDTIGLEVLSLASDDAGKEKGAAAKHGPDTAGVGAQDTAVDQAAGEAARVTVQLRAERMGKDRNGRTYTIQVQCSDQGNVSGQPAHSDTATLTVLVPHDSGRR